MVLKKTNRKPVSRGRLSLVPPSLNTAAGGTTEMAPPQEPWRERKRKGNQRGERKK